MDTKHFGDEIKRRLKAGGQNQKALIYKIFELHGVDLFPSDFSNKLSGNKPLKAEEIEYIFSAFNMRRSRPILFCCQSRRLLVKIKFPANLLGFGLAEQGTFLTRYRF
jgi:hypothetical protein